MPSVDPHPILWDVNMFSMSSISLWSDRANETGTGSIMIETTSLRSLKLVERFIFVDHPLLLKESRKSWSRSGARGKARVRRLDGSGYKVWARRGLLPMCLSRESYSTACDRAAFLEDEQNACAAKIYIPAAGRQIMLTAGEVKPVCPNPPYSSNHALKKPCF